jgi:hypothetical protein
MKNYLPYPITLDGGTSPCAFTASGKQLIYGNLLNYLLPTRINFRDAVKLLWRAKTWEIHLSHLCGTLQPSPPFYQNNPATFHTRAIQLESDTAITTPESVLGVGWRHQVIYDPPVSLNPPTFYVPPYYAAPSIDSELVDLPIYLAFDVLSTDYPNAGNIFFATDTTFGYYVRGTCTGTCGDVSFSAPIYGESPPDDGWQWPFVTVTMTATELFF